MAKQARKILSTTILLILLISVACASLLPNAHATEMSSQQKAIGVLNDVVGLNMATYTSKLNPQLSSSVFSLPQKDVDLSLTSTQSNLKAKCSFINDSLRQIYLSDYTGVPSSNQPAANTLEMAKGFLERYKTYTGNAFYGTLSSMLDGIAVNENATKTFGNVKLDVYVLIGNQIHEDLIWTYIDENGVPAVSKNLFLSYDDGFLQGFMDNWQFYKIAGTAKLSNQDAIDVALKAAQGFSYEMPVDNGNNVTISGFKIVSVGDIALSYLNYDPQFSAQAARGGDAFTLYPSWYIPLGFDKTYPGSVTGVRVRLWGDTGEISTIDPMMYYGASTITDEIQLDNTVAENSSPAPLLPVLLVITIAGGIVGLYCCSIKNKLSNLESLKKLSLSKRRVSVLCFLITSSLIIMAPYAQASLLKSEIYVSTCQQAYGDPQEFYYASLVATWIDDDFAAAGIDSDNNYGSGTTYTNIRSKISIDESNYMGITVFHFGHMANANNYYDSNGVIIKSSNVSDWTTTYKHYFIWLWTCNQANGPTVGMPPAWTEVSNLSPDALLQSDSSGHCFFGFSGSSPAISYRSFENYTQLAYPFIYFFYHSAIFGGTVETALNSASYIVFNLPYYQTPLRTGYETWWSGDPLHPADWYQGQMKMYGDKYVILHQ